MTSPVETIDESATVAEALDKMRTRGVTSVLVLPADPDDAPGFFSQTDAVARIVATAIDPTTVRVADVMSRPVITVPPETPITDCARLMSRAQIRRVLVHDGEKIVGIVSSSDVLAIYRR
jgi:CBS domain-containing protein